MSNSSILNRIQAHAAASGSLEPDKPEYDSWLSQIKHYTDHFLSHLPSLPVVRYQSHPDHQTIFDITDKAGLDNALHVFNQYVMNNGIDTASARYLGFIPGGGIPLSACADYVAALTNCYAGNIITAPGAVQMERAMLRWMNKLMGFPDTATGNLASGGSYATMIALVTAREAHQIKSRDIEKTVIYVTKLTHHSATKCLRTIGLQEAIIRHIPVDNGFRMDVAALQAAVSQDIANQLKPFLIIATAGTTDTGSIDRLADIAAIASTNNLWLHVDAAYGGFFKLTDYGEKHFRGISLADSITLDPHKGLFIPYGIGAVLIKDGRLQKQAFASSASYMQDIVTSPDDWSPSDMSPELTKHFRALRLWLPLQYYGVEPFRHALDEKLLLAQYFYTELQKIAHIQVACAPQLSIVTFRYLPKHGDANEFNKQLLQRINQDGRVFLSSTNLAGTYYIRMACLSFRTHLEDIMLTLDILTHAIQAIEKRSSVVS